MLALQKQVQVNGLLGAAGVKRRESQRASWGKWRMNVAEEVAYTEEHIGPQ